MVKKNSRPLKTRKVKRGRNWFENKIAWISGAIILLILIQMFVFRDEGFYSLFQLKQEIKAMEDHISRLEIEKAGLENECDRLLNDPDYLERVARERFRMAKPGEKVFHVVIESKQAGEKR